MTIRALIPINDIEMYFEMRGDGDPLVLLHGGGGIGANWGLIFGEPPSGYRLIIPDLRGHGRSTNPAGQFTLRQCALDVLALLDHLEVRQFKAIGLSLGAKTLLHIATQEPKRVDAMVLVSAAPYFPEQARALMRKVRAEAQTEAEWKSMRAWHQSDEQIKALWQMARGFADSYDDLTFTPPYLGTISARTLIIHGDRDELYPVRLAVELYESIPRAHLWVVPNAGHGPIFGARAEQFLSTALRFLGNSDEMDCPPSRPN
ncbi:MAG: alpha/beta fold hydrolase [Acidobacteriota bacterium]